jgi:hypothetical protein
MVACSFHVGEVRRILSPARRRMGQRPAYGELRAAGQGGAGFFDLVSTAAMAGAVEPVLRRRPESRAETIRFPCFDDFEPRLAFAVKVRWSNVSLNALAAPSAIVTGRCRASLPEAIMMKRRWCAGVAGPGAGGGLAFPRPWATEGRMGAAGGVIWPLSDGPARGSSIHSPSPAPGRGVGGVRGGPPRVLAIGRRRAGTRSGSCSRTLDAGGAAHGVDRFGTGSLRTSYEMGCYGGRA